MLRGTKKNSKKQPIERLQNTAKRRTKAKKLSMIRGTKRDSKKQPIERLQNTKKRGTKAEKLGTKAAKRGTKAAKLSILSELCCKIDQVKQSQNRIPYGFVSGLVTESKAVFPWVTRDAINNHYRSVHNRPQPPPPLLPPLNEINLEDVSDCPSLTSNLTEDDITDDTHIPLVPPTIRPTIRLKGGRAKGDTEKKKGKLAEAIVAAKNEITETFLTTKNTTKATSGKRVANGSLQTIIDDVKERRNLPAGFNMSHSTVRQRLKRGKTFASHRGHTSPLLGFEPAVLTTIKQMCRIRQSLTPTQGIALVNSMIIDTDEQRQLVEWKHTNSHVNDDVTLTGQVGKGYWQLFMKRNRSKIRSTRGQKYELDRSTWTTYANFSDMYMHNYTEMQLAGVAELLPTPEWMDRKGLIVEEARAFGCKCSHRLSHPDHCVVLDEVGGNINMKGDGHIGGEKYLCEPGVIPQQKASRADKHFTLLGLTLLTGEPLMCVVIFAGLRRNPQYEMGVDPRVEPVGNIDDEDYVLKNMGKGKLFPGGPSCTYRGKHIPCMCAWSPKGSMTSDILRDIVKTLDTLDIFDRSTGIKPVLLLDGHGSRMELPFLQYINNPLHLWSALIGVPYGTSMWQVGDSAEQNGSYKMALSRIKKTLVEWKQRKMLARLTIEVLEIMILINYAWDESFARVETNKTAIAERGWFPLNRKLLIDTQLRSTMTVNEQRDERTNGVIVPYHATDNFVEIADNEPTLDLQYLPLPPLPASRPNLQSGMSAFCLDAIVQNQDLMDARERIRRNREEGESVSDKLKAIKKMTAAKMFLLGKTRLGEDIRDSVQANYDKHIQAAAAKSVKDAAAYRIIMANYNSVIALNKDPLSWNISQLKQVLKALKTKDDTAMPAKKTDLYNRYISWQTRIPRPVENIGQQETAQLEEGAALVPPEDDGNEDEEDGIEAMLLLNGGAGVLAVL